MQLPYLIASEPVAQLIIYKHMRTFPKIIFINKIIF